MAFKRSAVRSRLAPPNKIKDLRQLAVSPFCLPYLVGNKIGNKISFCPPFLQCKKTLFRDFAKLGKEVVGVFFGTPSLFINLPPWPRSNFQIGFLINQGQ